MSRTRREASPTNTYHVVERGVGQQILFECAQDYSRFLSSLNQYRRELEICMFALCLMSNHVHLLVRSDLDRLALMMKKLNVSYVSYFNKRYDRTGHLLQDRFRSVPITSEAKLLETVRYIHLNPVPAAVEQPGEYRWSSYNEYLYSPSICDTSVVLGLLQTQDAFIDFHAAGLPQCVAAQEPITQKGHLSDAAALQLVNAQLGDGFLNTILSADIDNRNCKLRQLKELNLSIRQIGRLTGIGRGIVQRA